MDQLAAAIHAATGESSQANTLVEENVGSREQALGIDPISKAILQMHVTQITPASAEERAAVAEELTTQSRTQKEISDRLTRKVGGDSGGVEQGAFPARDIAARSRGRRVTGPPRVESRGLLRWVRPSRPSHKARSRKEPSR